MISLQACNDKLKNFVLGEWESESKLQQAVVPGYTEVKIRFNEDTMHIDDKIIPVIYKIMDKKVIVFSRGEKITIFLVEGDKIVLFLRGIGKRIYNRKK